MRIALDLDGVLADLQHEMIEETKYTKADFEQWGKPDYNHFISEASRIWRENWDQIQPVEDHLELKTAQLAADHHVDVVTNTAGPDAAVEPWLDKHGIQYEDVVRPYAQGCDKDDLDYHAYIDDNPGMAGVVGVHYLRDRLWNQHTRGDGNYVYASYEDSYVESEGLPDGHYESNLPSVIRVTNLHDVLHDVQRQ